VKVITGALAAEATLNHFAMDHTKQLISLLLNIQLTKPKQSIFAAAKRPGTNRCVTAAIKTECIKEIYLKINLKPTESIDNSGLSESNDSHSSITNNSFVNA
jgi:hypothetical protein